MVSVILVLIVVSIGLIKMSKQEHVLRLGIVGILFIFMGAISIIVGKIVENGFMLISGIAFFIVAWFVFLRGAVIFNMSDKKYKISNMSLEEYTEYLYKQAKRK